MELWKCLVEMEQIELAYLNPNEVNGGTTMFMRREDYLVDLNAFDDIEYSHDAVVEQSYVRDYR